MPHENFPGQIATFLFCEQQNEQSLGLYRFVHCVAEFTSCSAELPCFYHAPNAHCLPHILYVQLYNTQAIPGVTHHL